MNKFCLVFASIFGAGLAVNGLFMLVAPEAWYFAVPGVTSTGPFNQHFIRDIGLISVCLGAGFAWGAARPNARVLLWTASTIFLGGHALFHFWEIAVGICSLSILPRDFPAVTLPALIGVALSIWAVRQARAGGATQGGALIES